MNGFNLMSREDIGRINIRNCPYPCCNDIITCCSMNWKICKGNLIRGEFKHKEKVERVKDLDQSLKDILNRVYDYCDGFECENCHLFNQKKGCMVTYAANHVGDYKPKVGDIVVNRDGIREFVIDINTSENVMVFNENGCVELEDNEGLFFIAHTDAIANLKTILCKY